MYCINNKTKPIKWKELDDQDIQTEAVRRDIIDKQIPRICDEVWRFPKLIRDQYALDQVCSAGPVTRIHRFIDGMGGGTDETEQ